MKEFDYASLSKRFFAMAIDYAILSTFFFPITRIVKGTWLMMPSDHDWQWGQIVFDPICLIFLIVIFTYFIIFDAIGATAGKFIMRIRVVNINGNKPGIIKSFIRNILRLIDGLPALNILGVYLILTTYENTRLGDKLANTRVINRS